jgi:hypothetical protein
LKEKASTVEGYSPARLGPATPHEDYEVSEQQGYGRVDLNNGLMPKRAGAAIHLKLTPDELKSLDEASQLPPEYPQWMLAIQGADRLGPVDLWSQSVDQK